MSIRLISIASLVSPVTCSSCPTSFQKSRVSLHSMKQCFSVPPSEPHTGHLSRIPGLILATCVAVVMTPRWNFHNIDTIFGSGDSLCSCFHCLLDVLLDTRGISLPHLPQRIPAAFPL